MPVKIPMNPSLPSHNKQKWRKMKFWKSESGLDCNSETDQNLPRSVDDTTFELASTTTGNHSELASPRRAGSVCTTSVSMPESEVSRRSFSHPFPFMSILETKIGSLEATKGRSGTNSSTIQCGSSPIGGRTRTAESEGLVASAYAAATRALQEVGSDVEASVSPSMVTETLSPKVVLLHEVHNQCSSDDIKSNCDDVIHSIQHYKIYPLNLEDKGTKLESRFFDDHENIESPCGIVPSSPGYQRARLETMQTEINDQAYDTDEDDTLVEHSDDNLSKGDYFVHDSILDKFLWYLSCTQRIQLCFIPSTRDGDDGTLLDEGETETSSTTDDQTLSTYDGDNATDQEQTDEGSLSLSYASRSLESYGNDNQGHFPHHSRKKSKNDVETKRGRVSKDDNLSLTDSFMDQSHIYLLMTNTRQERVEKQKKTGASSDECYVAWKKNSATKQTASNNHAAYAIPENTSTSRTKIENQSNDDHQGASSGIGTWIRRFQRQLYPTESIQFDSIGSQERWLRAIQLALHNTGEVTPSMNSVQQRREAAQAAFRRFLHESSL